MTNQQLVEWFAQGSWKATRRLTLEYGLRFTWFTPWYAIDGQAAALSLTRYDPSQAPALIRPVLNNGVRVGENPVTGQLVAASLIGSYAPQTGNTANGMVVAGDSAYPRGFQDPFLYSLVRALASLTMCSETVKQP